MLEAIDESRAELDPWMAWAPAMRTIEDAERFMGRAVTVEPGDTDFVLGIFRYFTLHFSPAVSATLYLVAFNFAAQVGNVVLSQPLGALRDRIGYQPTFFVIAGVVLLAVAFAALVLKKDDQQVLGDPFVPGRESVAA